MDINKRIEDLGLEIPELPKPVASYEPAKIYKDLIFSSGQTGTVKQKLKFQGKVGEELTVEEGKESAKISVLNCLAELKHVLGDLNKIDQIIKIKGFVASGKGFGSQPQVIEGASALLLEIFSEKGMHARTAVGVAELPFNAPVEIEMVASIK